MAVQADRSGRAVTVIVTEDCGDIFALAGVSGAEKRLRCLERCQATLVAAIDAARNADEALDRRVADVVSQVAAIKAARPWGTL